jgi:hypothetical protein
MTCDGIDSVRGICGWGAHMVVGGTTRCACVTRLASVDGVGSDGNVRGVGDAHMTSAFVVAVCVVLV